MWFKQWIVNNVKYFNWYTGNNLRNALLSLTILECTWFMWSYLVSNVRPRYYSWCVCRIVTWLTLKEAKLRIILFFASKSVYEIFETFIVNNFVETIHLNLISLTGRFSLIYVCFWFLFRDSIVKFYLWRTSSARGVRGRRRGAAAVLAHVINFRRIACNNNIKIVYSQTWTVKNP